MIRLKTLMKQLHFCLLLITLNSGIFPIHGYASDSHPPHPRALPEGAQMRIGYGLSRYVVPIYVYSPDSTHLAVVSDTIGVWIYDANTGKELALLTGHTDRITSIAFSPDGKMLATGSLDKTVRLWNIVTFEHHATLTGHTGNTSVLAFSPDSKRLASGSSAKVEAERKPGRRQHVPWGELQTDVNNKIPKITTDGSVRTWDAITGKPLKTHLLTEEGWISKLEFATDNVTLRCFSTDGVNHLWNTHTGKYKKWDNKENSGRVYFSPDYSRFLQLGEHKTSLHDTNTLKEIAIIDKDQNVAWNSINFSQDSKTFITVDSKWTTIRVWDTATGEQQCQIPINTNGHHLPIILSPNGTELATQAGDRKGFIQFWDLKTGEELEQHTVKANIYSFRFSPDGKTLAIMCMKHGKEYPPFGQEILLWDLATKTAIGSIPYITDLGRLKKSAFVASGKNGMLTCGIGDDKFWLFDGNSGKYKGRFLGHTDSVNAVTISQDGDMIASASDDGTVRLWNTQNYQLIRGLKLQSDPSNQKHYRVNAIALSPDGHTLASVRGLSGYGESIIEMWDIETGELLHTLKGHTREVAAITFSPDGRTLATGGLSGDYLIRLWNTQTGKLKITYAGHPAGTRALEFSPDGKYIASTSAAYRDGEVQLWDIVTGRNWKIPIELPYGIFSLAFSSDGSQLACGGRQKIEIWDVQLRQHITTLNGHGQPIASLAYFGDDNALASASYDQTVVLWKPIPKFSKNTFAKMTTTSMESTSIGEELTFNIKITGGVDVAGYHLILQFDTNTLKYISSSNGDYLSNDSFFAKPNVKEDTLSLASTGSVERNGDGILATVTYEVVASDPTIPTLTNVIISDKEGHKTRLSNKRELLNGE